MSLSFAVMVFIALTKNNAFLNPGGGVCYSPLFIAFVKFMFFVFCFSFLSFLFLKGLGHAILGNFSTYQMVIELTKI